MERINSDTKWISLKYNPNGRLCSSWESGSSSSGLFLPPLSPAVCLLPHHHRHTLIYTHTRAQTLQLPHTNTLRPGFQCQVTFQIPEKCRDTWEASKYRSVAITAPVWSFNCHVTHKSLPCLLPCYQRVHITNPQLICTQKKSYNEPFETVDKKSFPPFLSWWEMDNEEPTETLVDFATRQTLASCTAYQYRARLNGSSHCLAPVDIFGTNPQKGFKRDSIFSINFWSNNSHYCLKCSWECLLNDFLVHREPVACVG